MNLIDGEVLAQDGRVQFVSGGFTLRADFPVVAGGSATLGVRPQHLRVHVDPSDGAIPVKVFAVEHLGRESVVILEDEGRNKLHALVEAGFRGRVGDRLHAGPEPAHCLLFDQAGKALSHAEHGREQPAPPSDSPTA